MTVTPATTQLTALGATVQLSAEVRDQNGQVMAGASVTWTSSNASAATVSGSGLVTAAGNGAATITATAGSASGTATVTVAQEVSAVVVSPAADTLVAGDTLRLSAEAMDANGHPKAAAEFTWASSDTLVAVVDDAGLVTGVGVGAAEVTATSSGVTGRAALTVLAPAPTTVAVTPDTVALTGLGQTAQLAAEVRDQSGRVMAGVAVSWSSADTTIAAVDSTGLVTAIGEGATTVAATAGQVSGAVLVTVMQSAGSVIVSPAADTVALGDTLRLVAEAFDENGHRVEGAEFRWSSSDISVATVDGSGLVTGGAEGKATITATAGDARGTAEITVENPDRAALVALYHATDGPNWVNDDNWLTDAPLRDWYGVETDASGRVVRIDLAGTWDSEAGVRIRHGLAGPIPAALGSLVNLRTLNLRWNFLSETIPPELGGLTNLRTLDLGHNSLTGSIPPELDRLASLMSLSLRNNGLSGPIPPEFGDLANLESLDLQRSNLSGPIPPELANLASLQNLLLWGNDLSGLIPETFLQLNALEQFTFDENDDLCAPGITAFVTWLRGIDEASGPYCNESDAAVLELLYNVAGGSDWTNSGGWLDTPALEAWYGVTANSLGQVVALDLTRNGLAGEFPASLGALTRMTELKIGGNADLSGRLPLSLATLFLQTLHYADTGVCAPADASFQAWLDAIPSHESTGVECAPLSDRARSWRRCTTRPAGRTGPPATIG